jgi:UPF0042 nucleotide-binding protein
LKKTRLVVLSGPSGSGKSTALNVLEDLGFYCVDNLPVALLPKFLELFSQSDEITKVATVVDVREKEFLGDFPAIFSSVKDAGCNAELIYLEAGDDELVRRFSETRRRHPLKDVSTPIEGITLERKLLADIKGAADEIVDTSDFNVHDLKSFLQEHFKSSSEAPKMVVSFVSFGFKYGVPRDADIVMDVRFLPNPYFIAEFKGLTGMDVSVREFVLSKKETKGFVKRFSALIDYLIPLYWKEGKSYLQIAIGCTGGKHRSVSIVESLSGSVASKYGKCEIRHRDIEKV